jgi:hypothetical protein
MKKHIAYMPNVMYICKYEMETNFKLRKHL